MSGDGYDEIVRMMEGDGHPVPDDYGADSDPFDASAPLPAPRTPPGEGPSEETLGKCAALDHSDTDNAKRLLAYFPDQLLVMQAAGVAGGDRLIWSGRHWDIDNGEAGSVLLAQRVGDFIQLEADVMAQTDHEKRLIEAGAVAAIELDALKAVKDDKLTDEQRARKHECAEAILEGRAAKRALAGRKASHRKFGVTSKNAGRIKNMLDCAAPRIRKPIAEFNASALSVATQTHTLHFRQDIIEGTGKIGDARAKFSARVEAVEGHRQDDYITALVPVRYDPAARASILIAWLEEMMPDAAARRTLQQYCGVSILGVPLQRFMFHYGEGANGKSVFLEMLVRLLGKSFAVNLPTESIIGQGDRNAGGASPDLIRLFGKRMVRVLELPEGKPLQSELIKKLTGGEEIPVRTLFKGFIDFTPRAKPHMSGNGLPKITDTSNGIWRRMLFLRWPKQIAEGDMRDLEVMVAEMLAESSGVFNWLVEGALDFLGNGLVIAPSMSGDAHDYRKEMDSTLQFAEDCLEVAPGEFVQASIMYQAYCEWAKANARDELHSLAKFGRDLNRHVKRDDKSKKVRRYIDVRLRADRPRAAISKPPSPDSPDDYGADEVPL